MWLEHIQMARNTFSTNLNEFSLSARCVTILDQIISPNSSDQAMFSNVQLENEAMSMLPWSVTADELLETFNWDFTTANF